MKAIIDGKEFVLDDIELEKGKILPATKVCLCCKRDINDSNIPTSRWGAGDVRDWLPTRTETNFSTICNECFRLFQKHSYAGKPADWVSDKRLFREAFQDIYNRKINTAIETIADEMQSLLVEHFDRVKQAEGDKVAQEKKKAEVDEKIRKLEEEKKKLQSTL